MLGVQTPLPAKALCTAGFQNTILKNANYDDRLTLKLNSSNNNITSPVSQTVKCVSISHCLARGPGFKSEYPKVFLVRIWFTGAGSDSGLLL